MTFRFLTAGESHGKCLTAIIEGIPSGIKINTENSEQLFVSMEGKNELKNSLLHLFRALKKLNPAVENAKQIRMSAIRNKLKTNNLREVQYFAGHRYVSSTERYKLGNIETLKKDVEKYHPLKKG